MKKWYKSKINILGLLLVLVGILEAADANLLGYLGIANPEKWMSILGVILVALRQMTNSSTTPILKVGGRKKRKKPKSKYGETYEFDEEEDSNFTQGMPVNVYSDLMSGDLMHVMTVTANNGAQYVQFTQPIQYNDFESLYFEVEVD